MADETKKEFDALKADVAELRKDMRGLMEALSGEGKDKLDEARERFRRAAGDAQAYAEDQVRRGYGAARAQTDDMAERTREQLDEHPLTILLGTFIAGLVLGKLLEKR